MQVLTAPGVMIHEIDKSQYSPAMGNTACYVMGFANKGEAYQPMEFTSRTAWLSYYGEPDNEAERYFYAAACEVLNQNGRLYCARLPYDNEAFEKMPAVKYTLTTKADLSTYNFSEINSDDGDKEINEVAVIQGGKIPSLYDLSTINEYRTDEAKVPANTFLIVDTTGATYKKVSEDSRKGINREVIGIIPVVTTAANALYAQKLINVELSNIASYEVISDSSFYSLQAKNSEGNIISVDGIEMQNAGLSSSDLVMLMNTTDTIIEHTYELSAKSCSISGISSFEEFKAYDGISAAIDNFGKDASFDQINPDSFGLIYNNDTDQISGCSYTLLESVKLDTPFWAKKDGDTTVPSTIALDAANYFSTIQPASDGEGFDPEHLKDIGVVVYRAYLDPTEGNKVSLEAVEAYCGSLYKDDKDPNTGVTKFIDTIINSQSKYINFFSNCFATKNDKKWYKDTCDILIAEPSKASVLGLYSAMTKEDISITKSIYEGMNKCFDKVTDVNQLDIDIVPDAGISNIASYLKAIFNNKGPYDLTITDDLGNSMLGMWKCVKATDDSIKTWKTVVQKLDAFCKNRKDCMFITECPRPLVLTGQKKVVRPTKPDTNIDVNILPYLKAVTGLNTNYGAGYLDWFEQADEYTGDFFWCPPSIKAMGVYLYTDANFYYWDAPAGLNRGIVAATDVAFSPNAAQAGAIYEKSWNYAINYPNDGIVLEGQKTFQVKPSAFDRVNVRRLFLRLERQAFKVARYFVYEGNTAYTRQRLVDALDPYFKEAKVKGGIYDYKIIADESINTPSTIDRNELHVNIGIKPVKAAEFIYLNFIALSTGGSWEEAGL